MGERNAEGVSRRWGETDRRHLQRHLEGLSLERFGTASRQDPSLGTRQRGERAAPLVLKFAGSGNDARGSSQSDLYTWCAAYGATSGRHSLARVGLVYSQQTAWFAGGERGGRDLEDATNGWYYALVEARVPFEMVHDRLLNAEHLASLKTLILPSIAAVSDAQCAQLRAFVERGGGLVATSETSLSDEWGVKRRDFGLADLFGVSFTGRTEGPMHNAYLRLEHDAAPGHPLLLGLEDAPRIIHGVTRLDVTPTMRFPAPPLTHIPSYPDLPMEKVFMKTPRTDIAQVFLREVGAGRVAYFPWDIDRTFWEILDVDHGKLLRNAVAWATNEPAVVTVEGRGVLDVAVWRQKDSMTVHCVNLTNPMMMKGPVREVIPVGGQTVRVHLPGARSAWRCWSPRRPIFVTWASGSVIASTPHGGDRRADVNRCLLPVGTDSGATTEARSCINLRNITGLVGDDRSLLQRCVVCPEPVPSRSPREDDAHSHGSA